MRSVSEAFQTLLKRIQPSGGEVQAGQRHFETIKTRLESVFTVKKFFKAGSFSRETFIRGRSDVDVFAQVTLDEIRWGNQRKSSFTVLDHFRKQLATRLPNTRVGRDVHAIVVEFSDLDMDVVPAAWAGFSAQHKMPLYLIPDGNGRWMESNPEIHNSFIAEANQKSWGKLRAVAQLFKFWRSCRKATIPISSFHVEMVLASEGVCTGVKSYAECLTDLLQKMAERNCVGIHDPRGISGNIPAIKSESQRSAALASVRIARNHAKAALSAERNGRMEDALRRWDYVFNYRFFR